ncbi:hypothetical protein ACEQ8H_004973 [Pleosporales sp. CAS-2024a]
MTYVASLGTLRTAKRRDEGKSRVRARIELVYGCSKAPQWYDIAHSHRTLANEFSLTFRYRHGPLIPGKFVKMPSSRLTYRRRAPYNTKSQKVRIIKTPGGELRYLHIKKKGTAPKCGDCGTKLAGIPALRPREYATVSRPKKTVQRAYGGSRCANCVQDRIVRAFLIEEQKVVKKVLKESQQKKR